MHTPRTPNWGIMEAVGDRMSDNDAPQKPTSDSDARERKAAADSLRRQIENLKTGREPRSLNEFAERKVIEDRAKEKEEQG